MKQSLLDDLLNTLQQKTGRRWEVTLLAPEVVEAKMFVNIDGRRGSASCPVSLSLLEDVFDVAVDRIISHAATSIGLLVLGVDDGD